MWAHISKNSGLLVNDKDINITKEQTKKYNEIDPDFFFRGVELRQRAGTTVKTPALILKQGVNM